MQSLHYPKNEPFDAVTGELLPAYRDAYLLGQLTPVPAQQIEAYLSKNSIQKSVLLGRYHELSASYTAAGRTLVPPRWAQRQLQRQASISAAGPWRRPVVRLAGGVLLALCLASGVQWLRNEPLVPAPVVAAVVQAAASASQATQEMVQRFTAPTPQPKAVVATRPKPKREGATGLRPQRSKAAPEPTPIPAEPVADVAPAPADAPSAPADSTRPAPAPLAGSGPAPEGKKASLMQVVRGRVSDAEGRPLPGATVLVPGTLVATTTDAAGDYTLSVPAGTSLKVGYAGFADEVLRTSSTAISSTHNVVLTLDAESIERRRRRR